MGIVTNRRRVMGGKAWYDAEIEYLETDGTQVIDTAIYPTQLNISIELRTQNLLRFGWIYNNNPYGTWIGIIGQSAYWDRFYYTYSIPNPSDGSWNTWLYDMKRGLYKNNSLLKAFTASLGTNQISAVSLHIIGYYDEYIKSVKTALYNYTVRISSCKIYEDAELVRDFIPVRRGTTGYMYDKVSGKLFGNSGTGEFVLGPDVNPVNIITQN